MASSVGDDVESVFQAFGEGLAEREGKHPRRFEDRLGLVFRGSLVPVVERVDGLGHVGYQAEGVLAELVVGVGERVGDAGWGRERLLVGVGRKRRHRDCRATVRGRRRAELPQSSGLLSQLSPGVEHLLGQRLELVRSRTGPGALHVALPGSSLLLGLGGRQCLPGGFHLRGLPIDRRLVRGRRQLAERGRKTGVLLVAGFTLSRLVLGVIVCAQ
ncbi:Uncharacterised protein [Mycobacteroides abscessus subsp. abscessus]|nr:Uncharacterised protein [Mycobacteroides abscessus subsp. abscessus]